MPANQDWPRGLRPYGPVLRKREYTLSSGYAQDLFIGDPVVANGTGRDVILATAGTGANNKILGSILGIYDADKVPLSYWNSGHSGVGYVVVADHPFQEYVIQENGALGATYGIAGANGNVNLASGTGSTVYYLSGWELASGDTPGSTAADQIRLVRPYDIPTNDVTQVNAAWIVRINNHQAAPATAGGGV